jgi:hypothetical protein
MVAAKWGFATPSALRKAPSAARRTPVANAVCKAIESAASESNRLCCEKGLERDARLAGSVTLRLDIGARGEVVKARNKGSDLPKSVVECVVEAAAAAVFPVFLQGQHSASMLARASFLFCNRGGYHPA